MKHFAALLLLLSNAAYAQCVHPQQDGTLIFTADTASTCTGYWLMPAGEYAAYLSSVEITVADTTAAFAWGFGSVVFFAVIAWKIGLARKLVGMA
jgi:hypothetical protein